LYHFFSSGSEFPPAEPVPEFAELTLLATVLVPDAPEAAEATVLASEATELAAELLVEAPSESEEATLDIWNHARMLKGTGYDGFAERAKTKGRGRGNVGSGGFW
jgi:hypothetical protein